MSFLQLFHLSVVFLGQSLSLTPPLPTPLPIHQPSHYPWRTSRIVLDVFYSAVPSVCNVSWTVSFSHPHPYQPHSSYTNLLIILGELLKLFLMNFLQQFYLSVMFHGQPLSLVYKLLHVVLIDLLESPTNRDTITNYFKYHTWLTVLHLYAVTLRYCQCYTMI